MDLPTTQQPQNQQLAAKQDSITNTRDLLGPQKELDPDTIRHILDTDPIKRSIYFAFCGYYEYEDSVTEDKFGKTKTKVLKKIGKDATNRIFNDAGGNWLYNSIMGLIAPGSASSKATQIQIFNLWYGRSTSMIFTLWNSIYIPYAIRKTYMYEIRQKIKEAKTEVVNGATITTEIEKELVTHKIQTEKVIIDGKELEIPKSTIRYNIDERIPLELGEEYLFNAWELNPNRIDDIVTFVCEAYLFTLKSGDGFTLNKFTEFVVAATQTIRREDSGINIYPQQKPGVIDKLMSLGKKG